MLNYEFGEMRDTAGLPLNYKIEAVASKYAVCISNAIMSTSIYKELSKRLPSPRLLLYFQYRIKRKIYPFILQGCVIQWHKHNEKPITARQGIVLIPESGIFPELKKCWDFKEVPIKLISPVSFGLSCNVSLRELLGEHAKRYLSGIIKKFNKLLISKNNIPIQTERVGMIACHYAEGFDYSRRNDLNWYPGSGINPKRVLIYFDGPDNKTGKPIQTEVIQQIESQGFKWVTLRKGIIENSDFNYWQAPSLPGDLFIKKSMAQTVIEKWLVRVSNDLLKQVRYWRLFYDEFNIRINYIPEEGIANNIAQAIAFDIDKKTPGVLVGKQRSEIFMSFASYCLGYHPKHLFFIWNKRAMSYLNPSYEKIENFIVSGYPNDIFKKNESPGSILRSKGLDFTVALFDNVYGPDLAFSARMMSEFYREMLEWVLSDEKIGIVIKSKKPHLLKNLSSIHLLLNKAIETGRCIRLMDEWGRFPSDASFGVDMAIGCGISSALIEAVIAGRRGIHCDMTHRRNHEFYKWGYEKIIFDNLERLMDALKRYKENPENEPGLGDWSSYLDQLDPFRDGRGGERIGVYIRWLLESFDKGEGRDEAIQYANKLYKNMWGNDKVINMGHRDEVA